MKPLLQFAGLDQASLPPGPLHLAIGMFDGVHLGHRSVIEPAVEAARQSGGVAAVLTFWPHPSALFRPEQPTPLLMPVPMKHAVLARLGVDAVIEQEFTEAFAAVPAGDFVALLKRRLPGLDTIYVGENWRYGRDRQGDVAKLTNDARLAGVTVCSAPRVSRAGQPISSSRIRELLVQGEIAAANALLGYPYFTEGEVEPGRQLGRTIGFPTLNLTWEPELKPRYGVYAVEVFHGKTGPLPGVANYGLRPTVAQTSRPLLEVHLLGPVAPTYGEKIAVQWLHFLRPESKFDSVDALRTQIETDRENARKFFQNRPALPIPKDA